jgi:5-methylcytosine-specific restriction protein A
MGKKTADFENVLYKLLENAEQSGQTELTIAAGELHAAVGGYPRLKEDPHHSMPTSSDVLRKAVLATDGHELSKPLKGRGATYSVGLSISGWVENGRKLRIDQEDKIGRNPTWSTDELILVLDLYFKLNPSKARQDHPEVLRLSEILNRLPIHLERSDADRYRNGNGVYMKMCNFLRFDPSYEGKGLQRGGRGEEVVWNEFANDLVRLSKVANAITQSVDSPELLLASFYDSDDFEAPEGAILTRLHKVRERSKKLVQEKKRRTKQRTSRLACEACRFDFFSAYGDHGADFIECHHVKALSTLSSNDKTSLDDLALVCANCHRMLHRSKPWLSIDQLRKHLDHSVSSVTQS